MTHPYFSRCNMIQTVTMGQLLSTPFTTRTTTSARRKREEPTKWALEAL